MDKLAEEILSKKWIEKYDKKGNPTGSYIIFHEDAIQAMQSYHEAKLKEELIEFSLMINTNLSLALLIFCPNRSIPVTIGDVDDYLKQRNNG